MRAMTVEPGRDATAVAAATATARMRVVCVLCFVLAAAWCTKIALVPMWTGRSYLPKDIGANEWYPGGVFALKDGFGANARASIWAPPTPHSEDFPATPRWPWQPVTRPRHVEIDVPIWVRDWAFAIFTLGAILGIAKFVLDRRTPHGFVTLWCAVAIALTASWLALLGLEVLARGNAPTKELSVDVFAIAAAVGILIGIVRHRHARAKVAQLQSRSGSAGQ